MVIHDKLSLLLQQDDIVTEEIQVQSMRDHDDGLRLFYF